MNLGLGYYIFWGVFYAVVAVLYTVVAKRYDILDHPNDRSSHDKVTIRGGGIVFPLAIVLGTLIYSYFSIPLALAIFLLAIVSFFDDLKDISVSFRMPFQLLLVIALLILDQQLRGAWGWNWALIGFGVLVFGGAVNMYNFMDGINGLNSCYTLLALITLSFLDPQNVDSYLYVSVAAGVICLFNARPKGKAIFFSGDIGSITSGFFIVYSIAQLVANQETIIYSGLIMVYIVDSGWTIVIRMYRGENLFEAHRSHIFQILSNELRWGHLTVTLVYILIQLLVNASIYVVIKTDILNPDLWILLVFSILSFGYFISRYVIVQSESFKKQLGSI